MNGCQAFQRGKLQGTSAVRPRTIPETEPRVSIHAKQSVSMTEDSCFCCSPLIPPPPAPCCSICKRDKLRLYTRKGKNVGKYHTPSINGHLIWVQPNVQVLSSDNWQAETENLGKILQVYLDTESGAISLWVVKTHTSNLSLTSAQLSRLIVQ